MYNAFLNATSYIDRQVKTFRLCQKRELLKAGCWKVVNIGEERWSRYMACLARHVYVTVCLRGIISFLSARLNVVTGEKGTKRSDLPCFTTSQGQEWEQLANKDIKEALIVARRITNLLKVWVGMTQMAPEWFNMSRVRGARLVNMVNIPIEV